MPRSSDGAILRQKAPREELERQGRVSTILGLALVFIPVSSALARQGTGEGRAIFYLPPPQDPGATTEYEIRQGEYRRAGGAWQRWSGKLPIGARRNQDVTIRIVGDITDGDGFYCTGGRHWRVYGNGHKVLPAFVLSALGGDFGKDVWAPTRGSGPGDHGTFWIDGVYKPFHLFPKSAIQGKNNQAYDFFVLQGWKSFGPNDGRKYDLIIQRCHVSGLANADIHGDIIHGRGEGGDTVGLESAYIAQCTFSTAQTGITFVSKYNGYHNALAWDGHVYIVRSNFRQFSYSDSSPRDNYTAPAQADPEDPRHRHFNGGRLGIYIQSGLHMNPDPPNPDNFFLDDVWFERPGRPPAWGKDYRLTQFGTHPDPKQQIEAYLTPFQGGVAEFWWRHKASRQEHPSMHGKARVYEGRVMPPDFMPYTAMNPETWEPIGSAKAPAIGVWQPGKAPKFSARPDSGSPPAVPSNPVSSAVSSGRIDPAPGTLRVFIERLR